MLCRKCELKLKEMPKPFDITQFLDPRKTMYCDNNDCEMFGILVVAGIMEEGEENIEPITK